jgi:hypothetical protein
MVDVMDKEAAALKAESLKLSWYMRGGLSYGDALQLSYSERQAINDLVKDNLETTKKTNLPFF